MKILIVVTQGDLGGAQNSVLSLSRFLTREGNNVTVGFGEGTFLESALSEAKVPSVHFDYLRRTYNIFKNILFIFEIRRYVDTHDIDIVHFNSSNSLFGAFGAKISKKKPKTVFTVRGLSLLDPNYTTSKTLKMAIHYMYKFLFICIDKVVFVSALNQQTAEEQSLVRDGVTIYNGVDVEALDFLSRTEARVLLSKKIFGGAEPTDFFLIGSIGRLAYPKNYEFIIAQFPDIIKKKPNTHFCIIGEGPEKEKYEQLISKLHLENSVHLLGAIDFAARYIKGFDLFVLPSIFEGMSLTLLESINAGVPILASAVGGTPEIVSNDTEQLHTLNDSVEFHDKVMMYIEIGGYREQICARNSKRSVSFSIKETGEKYMNLYQSLLSEKI